MSAQSENITLHTSPIPADQESQSPPVQQPTTQVKLADIVVTDQNVALNILVGFMGVAQKRGAFALDESAKIYECIKMFQGMPASN
jgi:hypothetical protein